MPFPPLFLGECLGNSECGPQQACQDYRCVDPCQTGACGQGAECEVRNHVAICRCPRGMTGDPHEVRELREAEIKKTIDIFQLGAVCFAILGNKNMHMRTVSYL